MIKEVINRKNVGITYFHHNWLQEITKRSSGRKPTNVEYQCHFWAVCLREVLSDSYLDHIIPVVFYNYPMKIGITLVESNAKDIQDMSDKTLKLAEAKALELLNHLEKDLDINLDKYTIMLVPMNTMHRHPYP